MKRPTLTMAAVFAALSLSIAACGQDAEVQEQGDDSQMATPESVSDIAAARSDVVDIAFENDYVRVLRFDLEPGASLPPHDGRRRVIYSLTDYEIQWSEEGEGMEMRSWEAGDVHAHDAGVHAMLNAGETTASFLVFERLATAFPAEESETHGEALPTGARSILTEPDLSVLEVELAPGEAQEVHAGTWRAIYSLSDYTIEWREGDDVSERGWSEGEAHWHEPGPHAARNVGDSVARWLIVAFER